jgi:hypothetical protein
MRAERQVEIEVLGVAHAVLRGTPSGKSTVSHRSHASRISSATPYLLS